MLSHQQRCTGKNSSQVLCKELSPKTGSYVQSRGQMGEGKMLCNLECQAYSFASSTCVAHSSIITTGYHTAKPWCPCMAGHRLGINQDIRQNQCCDITAVGKSTVQDSTRDLQGLAVVDCMTYFTGPGKCNVETSALHQIWCNTH